MSKAIRGGDIGVSIRKANQEVISAYVAVIGMGSDAEVPIFVAPDDGIITQVGFIPQAAITGADVDYYTLSVINKGAAGVGTDVIASKAYTNGVDVIAFDWEDLGTLANQRLSKGDTVTLAKVETASGMATPQLAAIVVFERAL